MSLPDLLSVGLAWSQMVALMPMLAVVDQPELEIMNEDIPEYEGPVALLGQSLALALVAIGAVKMVFSHNEDSEEEKRRRSIFHRHDHAHFYYQLAEVLDRQQCILQFVCWLAVNDQQSHNLTREQKKFIQHFRIHPSNATAAHRPIALVNLDQAYHLGQRSNSSRATCKSTYPRCQCSMAVMTRILSWVQDFQFNTLQRVTKFVKRRRRRVRSRRRIRDKVRDTSSSTQSLVGN